MNKNFIAENIKNSEFYNNLNKKLDTDEEIQIIWIIEDNMFNVYIHSCIHVVHKYLLTGKRQLQTFVTFLHEYSCMIIHNTLSRRDSEAGEAHNNYPIFG